jgi:hypothetical protein
MLKIYLRTWKHCEYGVHCATFKKKKKIGNRIGSAMISVLASSAIYCGFEPRSGQTNEYTIWICCFSAKLRIGIMCPSGAKYLPADCCFSELTLNKSNWACWSRTKWTSYNKMYNQNIKQRAFAMSWTGFCNIYWTNKQLHTKDSL